MAFKLRSGNNTPFKKIGEKKETVDQYNARVKAEYDSKMQSYNDSTAAYNNELRINELMRDTDGYDRSVSKKNSDGPQRGRIGVNTGNPVLDEYADLRKKNKDLGIYDEENRREVTARFSDGETANDLSVYAGTKFTGSRREEGDPSIAEDPIGEYQLPSTDMIKNKMKPTKPNEPKTKTNILVMKKRKLELIPVTIEEPKLETAGLSYDNEKYKYSKRYDAKKKEYVIDQYEKKKINGVYSNSGRGKLVNTDPEKMYKTKK